MVYPLFTESTSTVFCFFILLFFLLLSFLITFARMNDTKWSEHVILVDAEYVDKVAFDMIVNFERMLERRIPQADMAQWLECIALDGGMRNGNHQTQVVLIHEKKCQQMDNFLPAKFADLDGKAFTGPLGEFQISCVQVEEMVTKEDLYIDSLQIIANAAEVKRLMVVADCDHIYNKVREALRQADPDKHITVFSMQPQTSGNFRQEILGYSLMAALGIKSEELNKMA